MTSYSLRLRLLAGAAVAIFAALAVAWLAMTLLFGRHLEQRAEQELRRNALQLVAGSVVNAAGAPSIAQAPSDPRLQTPASGFYWQISGRNILLRSRSLWDEVLPPSAGADKSEWRTRYDVGPFGHRLILVERVIRLPASKDWLLFQLAQNEEELRAARAEFGTTMALFLALLGLALSFAAWIQVHLGLQPLAALKRDVAAMLGNATQRLSGHYPREVEPLTRTINDLASAREHDVTLARQRAADLAHGLKTPLAALASQSRVIREGSRDPHLAADGLDRAIAAAGMAVDAELTRARAAANRRIGEAQSAPRSVAERLIRVLEHTDKGMRLDYRVEVDADLRLSVASEDLTEILGPLLENAVRFARRLVRVTGEATEAQLVLTVEDDGPGIATDHAAHALMRGVRLDESGGGHGLGLSIARQLAEATGGSIALGKSALGGLRVELRWVDQKLLRK